MALNYDQMQKDLCERLCAEVKIVHVDDRLDAIITPFTFPDGDPFQIYLEESQSGKIRLTDMGETLMHLSYDMDIDSLYKGTRQNLKDQILREAGAKEDNGAFYIETSSQELSSAIFHFGQTLNKIYDLIFLQRSRVVSTFYEDLWKSLKEIVGEEKIKEEYRPIAEEEKNYWVDYKMDGKDETPLFLYGILNQNKALLATIMLEHFLRKEIPFYSLIVFNNQEEISPQNLERLTSVSNDTVSFGGPKEELKEKIQDLLAA